MSIYVYIYIYIYVIKILQVASPTGCINIYIFPPISWVDLVELPRGWALELLRDCDFWFS